MSIRLARFMWFWSTVWFCWCCFWIGASVALGEYQLVAVHGILLPVNLHFKRGYRMRINYLLAAKVWEEYISMPPPPPPTFVD